MKRPSSYGEAMQVFDSARVYGGYCDACREPMAEGFQVERIRVCTGCSATFMELSHQRHGGDFVTWPNR